VSDFNCRAIGTKNSKDTEVPVITVGDLFRLHCQGQSQGQEEQSLNTSNDFITDPQSYIPHSYIRVDKDKYILKIIETPLNEVTTTSSVGGSSFEVIVTSYRVGDQNIPEAQWVTSQGIHNLKGIHFKVESIINPQQPPQEPFGPAGPFSLKLPMMYWIVLAVVISVVLIFSIVFGVLKHQRKRLIAKLKEKDSSLSPYHQINAKLRQMMREYAFFSSGKLSSEEGLRIVNALDEMFKLYLTREFYIPAFDWRAKTILRDFKRRHRGLSIYSSDDLSLLLRELAKAQESKTLKLTFKLVDSDVSHLIKSIRLFVDKIEDLKNKGLDKINKNSRRFQ
jgi:hypothetical protein